MNDRIRVVDFAPEYARDFDRLNREWLDKYFRVEPIDANILSDPQSSIVDDGGDILFAVFDDDVVGTVALKHQGDAVFELTKMAVTEPAQGLGIGRALVDAAIIRFGELGGRTMYLESHSSLGPALSLYESVGFRHTDRPSPSEYERSDVYMEYAPA